MHEQDTDCDDPGAPARDGGGAQRTYPGAGGAGGGAGDRPGDAAGDLERAISAGTVQISCDVLGCSIIKTVIYLPF